MKNVFMVFIIGMLFFCANAAGQESENVKHKLGWTPNTETDLAGYKVYHGPTSRNYDAVVDVGMATIDVENQEVVVEVVAPSQNRYIAVTAYDTFGNESGYSDEVVIDDVPPSLPQGFRQISITKTTESVTTTRTTTETIYNP